MRVSVRPPRCRPRRAIRGGGIERRRASVDRPRHASFVNRETAVRAARLGALVDTQPAWHYKDAAALADGLGTERLTPFVGLRMWREAGVDVAINTDHMFGLDRNDALNPFNPFLTIYSAATRRTEEGRVVAHLKR